MTKVQIKINKSRKRKAKRRKFIHFVTKVAFNPRSNVAKLDDKS